MLDKKFFEKMDKLTEELQSKSVKNFVFRMPESKAVIQKPKGKKRQMRKRPDGKRVRKGTI